VPKTIPLSQGKEAVVDDADYARVSQFNWYLKKEYKSDQDVFYAQRSLVRDGRRTTQTLHVFIKGKKKGFDVHHKNHDGLDCRRANLEHKTHRANNRHRKKQRKGTSSIFIGVARDRSRVARPWKAYIAECPPEGGRSLTTALGYFATEEEAARAYDREAVRRWGPDAYPNYQQFPHLLEPPHEAGADGQEGRPQQDAQDPEQHHLLLPGVQEGVQEEVAGQDVPVQV
jgi:hypothetical protein